METAFTVGNHLNRKIYGNIPVYALERRELVAGTKSGSSTPSWTDNHLRTSNRLHLDSMNQAGPC